MGILNYSTKIAPEKTVSEIQARLVRNGARQLNFNYNDLGDLTELMFKIDVDNMPIFFQIRPNVDGVLAAMQKDKEVPRNFVNPKQAIRTAWRIEKDWLEAQLAKIESGLATPLQMLLPYALGKDGRTFYETINEKKGKMLLKELNDD